MTTVTQPEMKERPSLYPVTTGGWLGGLGNLLRKELDQWWGTKMWWIQLIIWVLILNGVTTIIMLSEGPPSEAVLQEVIQTFLEIAAFAVSFGVIATVQGAIVGEKELGTAAWVMSKPASRPAFILSKMAAYVLGFAVTAILVPAIIFIVETRLLLGLPYSLQSFLAGLAVASLSPLFYLALTLMLGTLFANRGPIIGICIALIMSGLLLNGMFPPQLTMITPWLLAQVASGIALETPLPGYWPVPIAAACFWIVLFTAVALWRFSREEF
ncbi:MAG: ABC transporter permease [Candidatus Promineifilaceae bacterium]|jgi:ABC-2 type transport system permease protein